MFQSSLYIVCTSVNFGFESYLVWFRKDHRTLPPLMAEHALTWLNSLQSSRSWVAFFKHQDQIVFIYVDMPPYSLDPIADFSSNHSFNAYFYSLILFCLIWAYNVCVLLFIMWMIGVRPVVSRRVCILIQSVRQLLLMNRRSFIVQFTQPRL